MVGGCARARCGCFSSSTHEQRYRELIETGDSLRGW
jgi:hypothetical protein